MPSLETLELRPVQRAPGQREPARKVAKAQPRLWFCQRFDHEIRYLLFGICVADYDLRRATDLEESIDINAVNPR